MNTTTWKKMNKEDFPDIAKEENIVSDYIDESNIHVIKYRSKEMYIIAMNITSHMVDTDCLYWGQMISDNYAVRMFQAEHTIKIDNKYDEIISEEKKFTSAWDDSMDYMEISVDDKNLTYCQYKVVETEDIVD